MERGSFDPLRVMLNQPIATDLTRPGTSRQTIGARVEAEAHFVAGENSIIEQEEV